MRRPPHGFEAAAGGGARCRAAARACAGEAAHQSSLAPSVAVVTALQRRTTAHAQPPGSRTRPRLRTSSPALVPWSACWQEPALGGRSCPPRASRWQERHWPAVRAGRGARAQGRQPPPPGRRGASLTCIFSTSSYAASSGSSAYARTPMSLKDSQALQHRPTSAVRPPAPVMRAPLLSSYTRAMQSWAACGMVA
jgi:hypothetical protein